MKGKESINHHKGEKALGRENNNIENSIMRK
jgi:hypothetical protein